MNDVSKRVTLCFATVNRPHCVQRLITSVRARYPEIAIIVAEQNDGDSILKDFYVHNNVEVIKLAADAGVAKARNEAVKRVKTQYILLADDDFIIGPEMDLNIPVSLLDRNSNIDILGGCLYDIHGELDFRNFYVRRWERIFSLDERSKTLISLAIDDIFPINLGSRAAPYFHCDAVMNWAVMRVNVFSRGAKWDERFTCNGEHEDFYLNIKYNTDIRVGYVPSFIAYHHHPHDYQYSAQRNRQEGWRILGEKWAIEHYYNSPVGFHLFSEGEKILDRSNTLDEFLERAAISHAPPYVGASFEAGGKAVVRGPVSTRTVNALISNTGRVHLIDKPPAPNSTVWPVNPFCLEALPDIQSLSLEILTPGKRIEALVGDKLSIPVLTQNATGVRLGVINHTHKIAIGARISGVETNRHLGDALQLTSMINDIQQYAYQYATLKIDLPPGEYDVEFDFWLDSIGWLHRPDKLSLCVKEAP